MLAVANPVELGFVSSVSHPGGNITGVTSAIGDLTSKLLELVQEAIPSASRVGLLYNEGNPLNYGAARRSQTIAGASVLGLELVWLGVTKIEDFEPAFVQAAREHVSAVIGIGDPLLFAERARIHDAAEKQRIPVV
jgi:putative ABC transport system substrate-binding protein